MTEFVCCDIFIRDNGGPLKNGDVIGGHTHNFPHATFLTHGKVNVKRWRKVLNEDGSPSLDANGEEQWLEIDNIDRTAPCFFPIEAQDKHEFTALEDGTLLYCLFVPRDPQTGAVATEWNGWLEATY